jgi:hypothetical protein
MDYHITFPYRKNGLLAWPPASSTHGSPVPPRARTTARAFPSTVHVQEHRFSESHSLPSPDPCTRACDITEAGVVYPPINFSDFFLNESYPTLPKQRHPSLAPSCSCLIGRAESNQNPCARAADAAVSLFEFSQKWWCAAGSAEAERAGPVPVCCCPVHRTSGAVRALDVCRVPFSSRGACRGVNQPSSCIFKLG